MPVLVASTFPGVGADDDEDFEISSITGRRSGSACSSAAVPRHQPGLRVLFRRGSVGEGARAQQYPPLSLDPPHRFELAGRVAGGEDLGQAAGCLVAAGVAPGAPTACRPRGRGVP